MSEDTTAAADPGDGGSRGERRRALRAERERQAQREAERERLAQGEAERERQAHGEAEGRQPDEQPTPLDRPYSVSLQGQEAAVLVPDAARASEAEGGAPGSDVDDGPRARLDADADADIDLTAPRARQPRTAPLPFDLPPFSLPSDGQSSQWSAFTPVIPPEPLHVSDPPPVAWEPQEPWTAPVTTPPPGGSWMAVVPARVEGDPASNAPDEESVWTMATPESVAVDPAATRETVVDRPVDPAADAAGGAGAALTDPSAQAADAGPLTPPLGWSADLSRVELFRSALEDLAQRPGEGPGPQAEDRFSTGSAPEVLPRQSASDDTRGGDERAGEPTADELSPEGLPADELSVQELPADEPRAEGLPAHEVSVPRPPDEPSAEELPAEELPAEELPADELPADELPAEELPADELSAHKLPPDDLPALEPRAEELRADELSVLRPPDEPSAQELPRDGMPREELGGLDRAREDLTGEEPAGEDLTGEEPAGEDLTGEEPPQPPTDADSQGEDPSALPSFGEPLAERPDSGPPADVAADEELRSPDLASAGAALAPTPPAPPLAPQPAAQLAPQPAASAAPPPAAPPPAAPPAAPGARPPASPLPPQRPDHVDASLPPLGRPAFGRAPTQRLAEALAHGEGPHPSADDEPLRGTVEPVLRRSTERVRYPTSTMPVIRPPVMPPTPGSGIPIAPARSGTVTWQQAVAGDVLPQEKKTRRRGPRVSKPRHVSGGVGEYRPKVSADRSLTLLVVTMLLVLAGLVAAAVWTFWPHIFGAAPLPGHGAPRALGGP